MIETAVLLNATPLILAALGCLIAVRAGVVNIAIEGLMLTGAFTAVVASAKLGHPYWGLPAAVLAGVALASLLAWVHLHLKADVILAGFALNLIAAGATVTLLYAMTGSSSDASSLGARPLPAIRITALDDVPVLTAFSDASIISWLALASIAGVTWLYFRTRAGLWIRAVGSGEAAVVEAGLKPRRIKWAALLASGGLAGLAGAQLSMFTTNTFVRDMVAGRGFIALGAVFLGLKHPIGTAIAALTFGGFEALSTVLQTRTDFPTDLVLALPYIATVLALAIAGLRAVRRRAGMQLA